MARKKQQKKKQKKSGASSGKLGGTVVTMAIYAGLAVLALYGMRHFFLKSDVFTVREIYVNKDKNYPFKEGEIKLNRMYSGRSIFLVDLKAVQALVKKDFPQLKKIEVRRKFPDRIEVDIVTREPVAFIDYAGGVVVDREAVVIMTGSRPEGLIRIKGMGFFLNVPGKGERVKNAMLEKGLVIVDGLRRKMARDLGDIDFIDISDRNNIILGIKGVAVKMGSDDFSEKIDRLTAMLRDPKLDIKGINYIDLRFRDAVIAPK
ncbi:MAG: FtsQ-type POTRA domain-containing protein [Candidatus Omnitrophica bacterium]|nr:FtsQ-type POTRA domain-containing protein [Candidatus Omnitrophota bacterium]